MNGDARFESAVVVMAMRAEAAPVVDALSLHPLEPFPSMPWIQCFGSSVSPVTIVVNGVDPIHGVDSVGTTAGALTTALAIERFSPGLVVSAGTAGGFESRSGSIGQVFVADGPVVHHDRRIAIDGFGPFAEGRYPSMDLKSIASELGFLPGRCSTGDSLDAPDTDLATMSALGTQAKDMEAAAVAGVAARAGVPFTALKVITDLVDGPEPTAEEFLANLTHAGEVLAEALPRFLSRLTKARP